MSKCFLPEELKNADPSIIMHAIVSNLDHEEVVFFIKENSIYINMLEKKLSIKTYNDIFDFEKISVMYHSIMFQDMKELLYVYSCNLHDDYKTIKLLSEQEKVKYIFVDELTRIRKIIRIENSLQNYAIKYMNKVAPPKPWFLDEFRYFKYCANRNGEKALAFNKTS